jgi:thiamine phosphate synthase YjbQ (UPF0047 family)
MKHATDYLQLAESAGALKLSCRSPTASSTWGPWEQVFYAEFDGRRRKRGVLKAIGE